MSADNYIGVYPSETPLGTSWLVVDGCASIEAEDCMYRGSVVASYQTREEALVAAHDHMKDQYIVEYGVIELSAIPTEPSGRCFVCVKERNIISPELQKCDGCGEVISDSEWTVTSSKGHFHNRCEREM